MILWNTIRTLSYKSDNHTANTIRLSNIGLVLGQRNRWWSNVTQHCVDVFYLLGSVPAHYIIRGMVSDFMQVASGAGFFSCFFSAVLYIMWASSKKHLFFRIHVCSFAEPDKIQREFCKLTAGWFVAWTRHWLHVTFSRDSILVTLYKKYLLFRQRCSLLLPWQKNS